MTKVQEGLAFAGLVAMTRLLLLGLLGWLVDGKEFTDDVVMHMDMVRTPVQSLLGTSRWDQHPPLLALFEALFAWPFQLLLPDFYAIRLCYIVYEVLAAFFFWLAVRALFPDARFRRQVVLSFVLLPMGFVTTVIMAQDEVIATLFMTAILWLLATGRKQSALLVCGLGVGAAKVMLVFPLIAMMLFLRLRNLAYRLLLGTLPVALVYGISLIRQLHEPTVLSFAPPAAFSISAWVLLSHYFGINTSTARSVSAVLALAAAAAMLIIAKAKNIDADDTLVLATLFSTMLMWFYVLFYHVNPEYYFIALPSLLLIFRSGRSLTLLALMTTSAYAVNFFFGVAAATKFPTAAKGAFVRIYQAIFPIQPEQMFLLSIWFFVILTLVIAIINTLLLARRKTCF
jgi:hypothetical protein